VTRERESYATREKRAVGQERKRDNIAETKNNILPVAIFKPEFMSIHFTKKSDGIPGSSLTEFQQTTA